MGKINVQRVVLGGLLAGLVFNVGEFIAGRLFSAEYEAALAAIGRTMPTDTSMTLYYIGLGFLFGIAIVYVYALLRSHFGPGPRTAMHAGLLVWLFSAFFHTAGEGPMGLLPLWLYMIGTAWWLVELPLAALAGAWVYRDPPV